MLVEQVDKMFAAEVDAMAKKFLEEHPEGVFVAYRMQQPPHMNATRLSFLSCFSCMLSTPSCCKNLGR